MIKLAGTVRLSRVSGGDESMPIHIELMDQDSHACAVDIHMGMEAMADMLTGRSADCSFEFNDSGVIGMQAQSKTELVPVPSSRYGNEDWIPAALAPFKVDGWKPRHSDIRNHHNCSRDKSGQEYQRVAFFRHVPKEPK